MKRIKIGAVAGLALMLFLNCAARAQLMQQVPADALMVVQINHLKATNDKIAKLAQDLGIAAMFPPAADPLGFLQLQTKMQQGLDTAGDLGFVMLDPANAAGDPSQAMLILIPISDYKVFLSNWPDATTEGDVSVIKFAGDPSPTYVANWGKYAVISPNKTVVSQKPSGGLTAPSVTAKELAGKDAILYANFTALKSKLGPELAQMRPMISTQVEQALGRTPQGAKFTAVVKAIVNQVMNAADTFVNNAQAATFGLLLTPEGINTTVMAEFQPDSYLGKLATGLTNTDDSLLGGLPKGKYLMYGGAVQSSKVMSQLITDIGEPIVKELLAVGPEMAAAQDYYNAMKAMVPAMKGASFGILAPHGALGTESIIQVVSVGTGDAPAMMDGNMKLLNAQQQLMKAINMPGMEMMKMTLTPNAKTIDGVSFNSFTSTIEMNAQNPMAMQQAQMMNMIYGPQGQVVLFGVAGDKALTCMGLSDANISLAIASAKGNANNFTDNENLKAVAGQLPKQRMYAFYIAVGDIVTSALGYAKQFGLALPVQLPPDLPPVGVTIASEGTALRVDTHVPTTLIQSLVAASMQAQMQMNGGGAPGGAPPGGGL